MAIDTSTWEQLAAELKSKEGGGIFFFLKEGRTRLRIVPLVGTENDKRPQFWIDTEGTWNGKPNKRRILLGIVAGATGREIPDEDKNKVTPLLVAPTVVSQIVDILASGFDLFSAKGGHAIAIVRSGQGLGTTYRVDASPDPIPLPDTIEYLDKNLEQLDVEYRNQDSTPSSTTGNNTTEETPVAKSAGDDW